MRLPSVLRARDAQPGVTTMELFFDVVYVFAVTQLSHTLIEHLSVRGAMVDGDGRLTLWLAAVAIDYGGPTVGFALPGAGRTPMSAWSLSPGHLAERCQLVVIIALGESILITGVGFSELERDAATVAAFGAAFLGSAALWWLYFARHAEAALDRVSRSSDPARLGRGGYAYAHAAMVAGVIVTAVGDELTIAHPGGGVDTATALTVLGGPAIYALGIMAFIVATGGLARFERIAGSAFFAALAVLALASRRHVAAGTQPGDDGGALRARRGRGAARGRVRGPRAARRRVRVSGRRGRRRRAPRAASRR